MFKAIKDLKNKYLPSKKHLHQEARRSRLSRACTYYEELAAVTRELGLPVDGGYGEDVETRCVQLVRNIISSDYSVSKKGNSEVKLHNITNFEEALRFRYCLDLLKPELSEPATSMVQSIFEATSRIHRGIWSEDDRISAVTKDSDGLMCLAIEDSETSLVLHIDNRPRQLVKIEDRDLDRDVTDLSWLSSYERHQIGKAISDFLDAYEKMVAKGMRDFYTGVYNGSV
ncbi:hypothetical protein CHUUTOTORO_02580 [Serratia phage vB_SmaM-ChuuTotoro]|nr:hypothetical protein CHUUTOTORO_02580 [Serratia phage vB_SmaM-ChuuTotoro]